MNIQLKLRRGDLRQALLDYAMQAAATGDIETMSLRQAARDLGVSSGAVYRHFPDKDSLLTQTVFIGHQTLSEGFRTIRPADQPAQSIQQVIDRAYAITELYMNFALERPALWRMMFGRIGVLCRETILEQHPEEKEYTPLDVVQQNFCDLHRLGAIPTEPTIGDIRFTWSAVHGAADLAQSGIRYDADDIAGIIDQTVRLNCRAIGFELPY